jgi:hypothetical protein
MRFCAICTNYLAAGASGAVYREPLGRGGAMVAVCDACRSTPAGDRRYDFNGGASRGLGSHLRRLDSGRRGKGPK